MASIQDHIKHIQESITVEISENKEVSNACPKCSKAGKEHTKGSLICSSKACRHVWDGVANFEPSSGSSVVANACPKCSKGGKPNHAPGSFICSNKLCRHEW